MILNPVNHLSLHDDESIIKMLACYEGELPPLVLVQSTCLTLNQHGHIHEHVVQLLDGRLQLNDVRVPRLYVCQRLLGRGSVHDDPLGKDGGVALLEHVLQLLVGCCAACGTDRETRASSHPHPAHNATAPCP